LLQRQIQVAKEQRGRDAEYINVTWRGLRAGKEANHRNIQPQDAKQGNVVVFDVRDRGQDADQDMYFGEWDKTYEVGVVMHYNKSHADASMWQFECEIYEPYTVNDCGNAIEPLWVTIAKAKKSGLPEPPSNWQVVSSLPWRAVHQVPIRILKAIDKNFSDRDLNPRMLKKNFLESGADVLKLPQTKPWRYNLPYPNVRFVMKRAQGEATKKMFKLDEHGREHLMHEVNRYDTTRIVPQACINMHQAGFYE
jgi:hypothetical protein